jgi:hypothetical protein
MPLFIKDDVATALVTELAARRVRDGGGAACGEGRARPPLFKGDDFSRTDIAAC